MAQDKHHTAFIETDWLNEKPSRKRDRNGNRDNREEYDDYDRYDDDDLPVRKRKGRKKRKQLFYDERRGRDVTKRKRQRSRPKIHLYDVWDDLDDLDELYDEH